MESSNVANRPRQTPVAALESRASMLLGVNIGLMTLATIFIFLRFYTRYVVLNRLGYDDWMALLALVIVLATGVTQCWMTQHGLGRHVNTIPNPAGLKTYTEYLWFSVLWYNTAIMSTKLALLAQYHRVLPIQSLRRACAALQVVIGLWGLSQIMLSIFTCFPIQAYWDNKLTRGDRTTNAEARTIRCIPTLPLAYQNAAGNIITYIAVLVLPLPALSSLRLPRAQKCLLIGIFCLGFLYVYPYIDSCENADPVPSTCALAAVRIMYFCEYPDPTWEYVDPSILSLAELCSGTICLCLPTLRPLAARWLPASLTSTVASATPNAKGGNRSTTNRSPVGNAHGGDPEKAAGSPKRPPPCARADGRRGGGTYYNSNTDTTTASSSSSPPSRRPSASLPRSSASGSDSDFIYGLETARKALPVQPATPSPPPMCMSIMRPLMPSGGGSSSSRRSSTAETSSVVRFAAIPLPLSSFSSSAQQQQQQRRYQQRQGNYYVHQDSNNDHGSYLRGQRSGNWLLESRVSTEIGTSNSPVPSEERRMLGSAAIRVKGMVTRRESVVVGW
ncbi:uncharacterized protein PG986_004660 [Apiospora aurea]|uniref:Rhodopsin domain-containing protein n=1 Tax=Apiospora aurea TaxID=335848 RepID=A0ABR1QN75_9PEZI